MLEAIQKDKALKVVRNYYDILAGMGFINEGQKQRMLAYLFIIDYIDYVYDFLTDFDYALIESALKKLFVNGGCLMPYTIFKNRNLFIGGVHQGLAHYMGNPDLRISENVKLRLAREYNVRLAV